jgi:hypothetical protein
LPTPDERRTPVWWSGGTIPAAPPSGFEWTKAQADLDFYETPIRQLDLSFTQIVSYKVELMTSLPGLASSRPRAGVLKPRARSVAAHAAPNGDFIGSSAEARRHSELATWNVRPKRTLNTYVARVFACSVGREPKPSSRFVPKRQRRVALPAVRNSARDPADFVRRSNRAQVAQTRPSRSTPRRR